MKAEDDDEEEGSVGSDYKEKKRNETSRIL